MPPTSEQSPRILTRRKFVTGAVALGAAAFAAGEVRAQDPFVLAPFTEPQGESETDKPLDIELLRHRIETFSWKLADNPDELWGFTKEMAKAYKTTTKTSRLTQKSLLRDTYFFGSSAEYAAAVQGIRSSYNPNNGQWGYTDYSTGRVFIDLQMVNTHVPQFDLAGTAIANALLHEWGHADVTERREGDLLNNPERTLTSAYTGEAEQWRKYRGGEFYTDTSSGMERFEEVLNESIVIRRMSEQFGLSRLVSATLSYGYHENGTEFFPELTIAAGISLDELYEMHATSDFEGLATKIGLVLGGPGDPLSKGANVLFAIHHNDSETLRKTGVRNLTMGKLGNE